MAGTVIKKAEVLFLRNKLHFFLLSIMLGLGIFLFMKIEVVNPPQKNEHFDILTINTVLAGFMYTVLSTMIEFNTRKRIQELDKAGYMDAYYSSVYIGLTFFVISIFLGLLGSFVSIFANMVKVFLLEVIFMFYGFVYFVISAIGLVRLLKKVRKHID